MEKYTRTSERLLYRVLTPDDLDDFFELVKLQEVGVWMGIGRGKTKEEALAKIQLYYEQFLKYDYGCWGCFDKVSGKLVGQAGLEPTIYDQVGLIYAFLPETWGHGYGEEACRQALRYGFEDLGLDHIIAGIRENNQRSRRVVEKNGMVYQNLEDFKGVTMTCYKITKDRWFNDKVPD